MKMRMLGRFLGFHETNHVGFNKADLRRRPKLVYLTVAWFFIVSVLILGHPSLARSAVFWSDDFESGGGDWHADSGTWEVGEPTSGPGEAYDGQNCAATVLSGNYSEPVDSRLIRHISFVVPSASGNPRLRFWHWYSFSSGDYGKVQIKEVGSDTWEDISASYTNTSSGVWTYTYIDLSGYAGLTVQIAFYFHSQDNCYGSCHDVSTGWYIDEVEIITGDIVFTNPEDWESGIDDWSAERGTWQVGTPTSGPEDAYDGQNCAATVLSGNYWEPVDSRLISPPIDVPIDNPRLRFWHWYSFSSGDYGKVQIKEVGSDTWEDISASYTNTSSGVWTYTYIDLSGYAGLTVQIAFYFHSQDNCYGSCHDVSTGWYIDEVTIEPLPDLPQINSFTATPSTIDEGGSSTLSWDIDGATSAEIDNGVGSVDPSSGSVQVSPADTTTYMLTATNAEGSVTRSVTVTVGNTPPVANDDQGTTQQDTFVSINVVTNDTDPDGTVDPTTVAIVTDAGNGTTTNNGDGTVSYTPDTGFSGTDTFTYTVDDNEGATSNEATVTVTVNPVIQPPVANDDQATTQEDTSVKINVVSNDTDPDGTVDPTTVAIVTDAANGTTTNNGDGTVTYAPNTGFVGTDTFTYTVDDDEGATSNEATVTVTVNPVIQPPVANDDAATTQEDTAVTIDVVSNDTDPDGSVDPTTVSIVTDAANGTTTNNGDGTVTYTPDTGFAGTDTFTYTVDDNEGATSNEATVAVTVTGGNQPPVANNDSSTTDQDTPVTINVVSNDTDADGTIDPTTVTIVSWPTDGTVVNNGDGTVTYTPDTGFTGADSFTYTVDDDEGATSNEATVTVTVAWPPQPPVANNDTAMTDQDIPVTINVVSNDTDADGTIDPATVTIVSGPTDGTVVNNGDGTVTYTPDTGFTGTDTFTYTVDDNEGATSNQATVVVSVGAAKTICPYLGDHLFAGFSSFLDCDAFTFNGEEGEEIIIKLEEDPLGAYTGENAVLVCESPIDVSLFKINRKFWLTETERGELPLEIIFALPTAGQYRIKVGQSLFRRKDGRFYFGDRFKGHYCLTLGSSGAAWQTLEPTSYPPTTKVE